MKVLTSEQMKNIDKKSIEEFGIEDIVLMEQAAMAVSAIVEDNMSSFLDKILVVAGGGNNGGDGVATARILRNKGYDVDLILLKDPSQGSELLKKQVDTYVKHGWKYYVYPQGSDLFLYSNIIVDAITGIGFRGSPHGIMNEVIDLINGSNAKVVSVDIPSGVDANTGKVIKAVKADVTITFGSPKIGHILYPGREYRGILKIAQLSFPSVLFENINRELVTVDIVKLNFPKRFEFSNKYDYGVVTVLGGSYLYPGAPILSALAAHKLGAGLVRLITPNDISSAVLTISPSIIFHHLNKGFFEPEDVEKIFEITSKTSVYILGPGLSREEKTMEFVRRFLDKVEKPVIIDGDALYAVKDFKEFKSGIVLTPHSGEFKYLTNKGDTKQNLELAENYAKEKKVVLLLKDATSIITDGEKTYFNITGNSALSKGGSGDLLTGFIGALIAQKAKALEACAIASYILGKIAEESTKDNSEYTLTHLEMLNQLSETLRRLGL